MAAGANGAGAFGIAISSNLALDVSKCLMLGNERQIPQANHSVIKPADSLSIAVQRPNKSSAWRTTLSPERQEGRFIRGIGDGFGDHSVFYYSIDPDIGQKTQILLDEETICPISRRFTPANRRSNGMG